MTHDSLFTRRIVKNEQGIVQEQMVSRELGKDEKIEEADDFTISKAISAQSFVTSFFEHVSHIQSGGGFILLVNGSSLYIWNRTKSEWKEQINFDSRIVAIHPFKQNLDGQDQVLCITESSLELLVV